MLKKLLWKTKESIEYYEKWKKTYPEKQWKEVIEKEIKELEEVITRKEKKSQIIGGLQ